MLALLLTAKEDAMKPDDAVSSVEPPEPQPSTFTVKEKFSYFKPRVEVEFEEEGNKSSVKEIYIRGTGFH